MLTAFRRLKSLLPKQKRQSPASRRRVFSVEALETRCLMAMDVFATPTQQLSVEQPASSADVSNVFISSTGSLANGAALSESLQMRGGEGLTAEGEPADDLVGFAKALAATTTVLYGADWHTGTTDQRQLFQDGAKYLPFVNATNPNRSPNQTASQNNITVYPTWAFPDGSRLEGVQSLATISLRSGVAIPTSETPYLTQLNNTNVGIGSPLHVPIDAYSPTGRPLTVSVTSSNPSVIAASVLTNNRSLQIMTDFGDMVFELFEDKAPRAAGQVIQLAQSNFYDGIIFHRIISNFMIQGGDPTGTGTSGSTLPVFNDQYHLDLQHNRTGVLSYAKAGDDTNNSQFFITAGPTRHLDFNHSVFGQLVEGNEVRQAISQTATAAGDRPVNPVIMRDVSVFEDAENAMLLLRPLGAAGGTSDITVTVSDGQGNQSSRIFVATVVADVASGRPFLNDIPTLQATAGVPLSYTLTSQDKESNTPFYDGLPLGEVEFDLTVNSSTGVVNLTVPPGFVGELEFLVGVRQDEPANTSEIWDTQVVKVQVATAPVANADNAHTLKNESVTIDVLSNDVDGGAGIDPASVQIVEAPSSGTAEVLSDGRIRYVPTDNFVGQVQFKYVAADDFERQSNQATVTVNIRNSRWRNPLNHLDVSRDGRVTAFDALQIINYLNSGQPSNLPDSNATTPPYVDPNDDLRVTALDALLVINFLNTPTQGVGSEGEPLVTDNATYPSGGQLNSQNPPMAIAQWQQLPSIPDRKLYSDAVATNLADHLAIQAAPLQNSLGAVLPLQQQTVQQPDSAGSSRDTKPSESEVSERSQASCLGEWQLRIYRSYRRQTVVVDQVHRPPSGDGSYISAPRLNQPQSR
jgi:cyclophilin family peptidyl-prolyl cis-trans isomerase